MVPRPPTHQTAIVVRRDRRQHGIRRRWPKLVSLRLANLRAAERSRQLPASIAPNCQQLTDVSRNLLPLNAAQARGVGDTPHSRSEGNGCWISERYRRRSIPAGSTLGRGRRRCWRQRTAWDALASELQTTAASYASTISELTSSGWQGPSSVAAADAAAPYTAWLSSTGAQAEQTASQAQAAAGAYEAAFAASIPPPLIAANRATLALLVATNLLGQNTPAIAANEATYAEFWAQDAVAMYGYAGASTTASSADLVHRTAGDHQRQRAGHPVGCGREFGRGFGHHQSRSMADTAEHRIDSVRHPAHGLSTANSRPSSRPRRD